MCWTECFLTPYQCPSGTAENFSPSIFRSIYQTILFSSWSVHIKPIMYRRAYLVRCCSWSPCYINGQDSKKISFASSVIHISSLVIVVHLCVKVQSVPLEKKKKKDKRSHSFPLSFFLLPESLKRTGLNLISFDILLVLVTELFLNQSLKHRVTPRILVRFPLNRFPDCQGQTLSTLSDIPLVILWYHLRNEMNEDTWCLQ